MGKCGTCDGVLDMLLTVLIDANGDDDAAVMVDATKTARVLEGDAVVETTKDPAA